MVEKNHQTLAMHHHHRLRSVLVVMMLLEFPMGFELPLGWIVVRVVVHLEIIIMILLMYLITYRYLKKGPMMVELVVKELIADLPTDLIVLPLLVVVVAAVVDCQSRYQAMKLFELVPVVGQLEEQKLFLKMVFLLFVHHVTSPMRAK